MVRLADGADLMAGALNRIPRSWRDPLRPFVDEAALGATLAHVAEARLTDEVYPSDDRVFAALALTAPTSVRVVILGQDPYPSPGMANGLAFSVSPDTRPLPGSLQNIFRSLDGDGTYPMPASGSLEPWARQGVLLLNTILTVRRGQPGSHKEFGWQTFTNAVIRSINGGPHPVVFLLWGRHAQAKSGLIDAGRHRILVTSHPSPLSARRGFLADRPLLAANRVLRELGFDEIDWRL